MQRIGKVHSKNSGCAGSNKKKTNENMSALRRKERKSE